ncbi:VanZ family protein [Paenibacillus sp. P26]|nr:VanZ family protein [Paenibacillus sp. P26]UUZ91771.1 VanZ family protein [Paenibacillus sp. P25]
MKAGSKLKNGFVRALLTYYMYVLFKIIVLKFGPTDVAFLWKHLQQNMVHSEYIVVRLQAGNLIPLKEISRDFDVMSGHSLLNLLGNIALFVPFGMLLGALAKAGKLAWAGAFWRSMTVSLGLESAQVLFSIGTFDVDDLILNSVGGTFGFLVYRVGSWLTTPASRVPSGKPAR